MSHLKNVYKCNKNKTHILDTYNYVTSSEINSNIILVEEKLS